MKIVATVEARMKSSRLPGKVLAPVLGRPALGHLLDRLGRARFVDERVVATTVDPADDPIEAFCRSVGVACFRGSEEDVLGRVLGAAESVGGKVIVEITGDCTLLCPEVVDRAIDLYMDTGADVVCNTSVPSYPQGVDAQVFAWELLQEASRATRDSAHREHVSLYFYENPQRFRIHRFEAPPRYRAPHLRFQLDYPEDLEFIRTVYAELHPSNPEFSLPEIFDLLERRPELLKINAHCVEKPVR